MVVAHGAPVGERYRKADAVREHAQNNALALVHREGGAAARHPVDRVFWDDAARTARIIPYPAHHEVVVERAAGAVPP